MADWIKFEKSTLEKVEVFTLAREMKTTHELAVFLCLKLWCWADSQTTDGYLPGVQAPDIDRTVGRDGFAAAMRKVGWMEFDGGGCLIPLFDRHMGKSAKARALNTARHARARKGGPS